MFTPLSFGMKLRLSWLEKAAMRGDWSDGDPDWD